jgi:hypothetical protein
VRSGVLEMAVIKNGNLGNNTLRGDFDTIWLNGDTGLELTGSQRGGNDILSAFNLNTGLEINGDAMFGLTDRSRGGNDKITGSNQHDSLTGDAGQHIASNARGGDDEIRGGRGIDNINGDSAVSIFDNARGGNDKLYGGDDGDFISGDSVFMHNFAIGGNDNLYGDDGKDELVGDAYVMFDNTRGGDDRLEGGNHDDYLYGDAQELGVERVLLVQAILQNNPQTGVQGGNDYLLGGSGDDHLYGDWGVIDKVPTLDSFSVNVILPPIIEAHGGNDKLDGGAGNDDMWGNGGDDIFIFGKKSGRDTIWDFNQNEEGEHDRIDLRAYKFDEWRSFKGNIRNDGDGNVVIKLSQTDQIKLMGVTANELHSSDFIL